MTRNVILIGARGCGKTSVGRALARRLGWPFVDTDEEIQTTSGRCIRDIFAQDGEPAFRALETLAIAAACRGGPKVLSVGGGAVLRDANRGALRSAGVCFWLTAPAEELHRRTQADCHSADTRPALTAREALDELRHLLAERAPLYAATADHVVDTAGRSVAQVVETVLKSIGPVAADAENA